MGKINDGGPAFPQDLQGRRADDPQYQGVSLRDWFATHASENDIRRHQSIIERSNGYTYMPSIEECKYHYADAMIAARGVSNGN